MSRPKKTKISSSPLAVNNLHPTAGYLLVELAKQERQTISGIYLPDSHDDQPQYGTVLAVGDPITQDGKEVVSPVKAGQKVLYKKWGGNEVKIADVEYQFLKFEDILALIK